MFNVIEFSEEEGGGISVIRHEWLTPRKQHSMWPPHKINSKFNKCINGSIEPDETWKTYKVKRIFYETDSLPKAREKAKQAEIDSEINSDDGKIRKRKKKRKIYESDDTSESNTDDFDSTIIFPTPPATRIESQVQSITLTDKDLGLLRKQVVFSEILSNPSTSTDGSCLSDECPTRPATQIESQVQYKGTLTDKDHCTLQKQVVLPEINSNPSTSTDEACHSNECINQVTDSEASMPDISTLDLTLTPLLKEWSLNSHEHALDVIAKHLAHIENAIKELQTSQQEILLRIRGSSTPIGILIPDEITLPCDDNETMNKLENWILLEENSKHLVNYLSLVGGSKIPAIIRRVLEKVFTSKFALLCNWTGKNNKIPIKDLKLITIIREAVRKNKIAEKVTDAEIHEVISNWFRFAKDRNGGREARRVKQ